MNSIYDIVKLINVDLEDLFKSKNLIGSMLYGIAESVITDDGFVPVIGEKYVGVDDTHPLSLYHRLASLSSTIKPNSGVGRNEGLTVNTYSLGMILFLDQRKTKLYPDEMMMLLQANFPERFKLENAQQVIVRFSGAVLDSKVVHSQEYSGNEYRLKENQFLFRINYSVEMTFDKNCFKKC